MLEVNGLSLNVDEERILHDLDMSFEKNRTYAVVGPNGAGKSSLAFTIMGLKGYRDIQGEIIYKDESLKDLAVEERARKGIALAWQAPARYEGMKVEQFLQVSTAGDKTASGVLSSIGMDPDEYLGREIGEGLSGGERKKIELASVIAMNPELALLDEPDSGIDIDSLEKIFGAVETLKEEGSTVVFITHSETALEHTEFAYLMRNGKIVDKGSAEEIRNNYFNRRTE